MKLFSKLLGILTLVCFFIIFTWIYPIEGWPTRIYVWIQFILAFVVIAALWRKEIWETHTNTTSSILTVIGIFGTFLGIYFGLNTFNVTAIEASIPGLLEGLKLAFLTSLVGIGSALILKFIALFQTTSDRNGETIERFVNSLTNTLQDVQTSGDINLLSQLVTLNTTIRDEGRETRAALSDIKTDLTNIHKSLTGGQSETITQLRDLTTILSEKHNLLTSTVAEKHDNLHHLQREEGIQTREKLTNLQAALTDGQSALRTQLENLTTVFSSKHDLLINEFQTFSKNVAESVAKLATDELIEALKRVIEEFNAKISEQFGENFKQLNEAVGRTVVWQEQYRQQMDKLADEFWVAAESIEKSRESVELIAVSSNTIAVRSESIIACTERLNPILHTLNDQLDAFSELRQRALDAFPLIENQLTELTTGFSSAVQAAIENSHASMETQRATLTNQSEQLQMVVKNTTQDLNQLTTRFSESVDTSITQAHASINQQRVALIARFSELESAIKTANQQLQGTINGVSSELDNVFEKSANHIAQLTTDFTQNLTQHLENTLNEITTSFSDTVATAIADSHTSIETQRAALDAHSSTLQTTINDVAQRMDRIIQETSDIVDTSQSSMNQQRQELLHLTQQLQSNFRELEGTLETELTKSLQILGGHLAALSEKFVENYTSLTENYTSLTEELYRFVNPPRSN